MKKLMIVAAAAAMVGTVSAIEAQVYDALLTVKTTACKNGKYTAALEKFGNNVFGYAVKDDVQFRKQTTKKIGGVFWGCDCNTIANPQWRAYYAKTARTHTKSVGGYAFWDATSAKAYIPYSIPYVKFEWLVLNRIDQMKSVEGTFLLRDRATDEAFFFVGGGFGTAVNNTKNECDSYISNISGNFAGAMQYASGDTGGCIFCGINDYGCLVAPFCVCTRGIDTTLLTAAYGTWNIKYNATASKGLKNATALKFTQATACTLHGWNKQFQYTYITQVAAYRGKAFTTSAGDGLPTVQEALEAERVAFLKQADVVALDEEKEEDLCPFCGDEEGKTWSELAGELPKTQAVFNAYGTELDIEDTAADYFAELDMEDPGLASKNVEGFGNLLIAKFIDAS